MKKIIIALLVCAACAAARENDYLKYDTMVRLFWNDDVMAVRDTVLLASSIKLDGRKWRVMTVYGDTKLIYCDGWKPEG